MRGWGSPEGLNPGQAGKTSQRSWCPRQVLKWELIRADGEGKDGITWAWATWSRAAWWAEDLQQGTGEPQQEVRWERGGGGGHKGFCRSSLKLMLDFVLRARGSHGKVVNKRGNLPDSLYRELFGCKAGFLGRRAE